MRAHETSEATGQSPVVTVRRIQVPAPRRRAFALPLLAVGLIVGVVVGGVGGMLLADTMFDLLGAPSRVQKIAGTVFVALCLVGGGVGWCLLWGRLWPMRVPDRPPGRARRLQAALSAPHGPERLPHRAVEHLLRSGYVSWLSQGKLLKKLQAGLTLVANGRRRIDSDWRPAGVSVPFEPVALERDSELLSWLLYEDAQEQGVDWDVIEPRRSPAGASADKSRPQIKQWVALAALMAFPAYGAFRILTGRLDAGSLLCLLGIVPFLLAWFVPLMEERTWWLVPGGLLCRESRMWRRRMDVFLFTAEDSVLFLEMKQGIGIVTAHGQTLGFGYPQREPWVTRGVLSAWLSRGRRPTREEAGSFIRGRD